MDSTTKQSSYSLEQVIFDLLPNQTLYLSNLTKKSKSMVKSIKILINFNFRVENVFISFILPVRRNPRNSLQKNF